MFCRNCGAEMSDTAKFCPKCGTPRIGVQTEKKEIIEDNQVIYEIKPEFNLLYKVLENTGIVLFYVIIFSLVFNFYRLWIIFPITLIATLVIVIIIVLIKTLIDKMQYNDLEYNFYKTKIEYKDGFFNKEEKELKYKHIREITMSQGILERICGIGTIKIFTNASSGVYNANNHGSMRGRNGIYIHCIENVQEEYKKVKQIIDEGTPDD